MKKIILSAGLMFALIVFAAPGANAGNKNEIVILGSDEVITDAFYARAGGSIDVAGTVQGDVVVAGGNITVTGVVEGDVLAVGGNITINGPVQGNVRAVGGNISISGDIGKNVTAFGGSIILSPSSSVGGGVLAAGGNVELRGVVERDTHVTAGAVTLSGTYNAGVEAMVGNDNDTQFNIHPNTVINGPLSYMAAREIVISENVTVGEVYYQPLTHAGREYDGSKAAKGFGLAWLFSRILGLLALLVIGLIFLALMPKVFDMLKEEMERKPGPMMLQGLGFLVITPLVAIVLALTLIGIPLSLIIFGVYFILLYTIKVFAAYFVGSYILKWLRFNDIHQFVVLLVGLVAYIFITSVPFVGWLFWLIITIWALGAMMTLKHRELKRFRK